MPGVRSASTAQQEFLEELLAEGLLIDGGVPGIYGRSDRFERIRLAVDRLVDDAAAADHAERLRFPPVMPRRHLETSGYPTTFPHLTATIFAFEGDEADAHDQSEHLARGENWSAHQKMSDLALTPAGCYPVYPAVAARAPLEPEGIVVDAGGTYVFRHEPSHDPSRMQMFHQRELVRIGRPEAVTDWRAAWLDRALTLLGNLDLEATADLATDPFFGRQGRILASGQRQQALKFEVVVPIGGDEPTAVASFNYHRDHFSQRFGIRRADDGDVHTACLGFGLERITLALLYRHGLHTTEWDPELRQTLRLT